MTLMTPDTSRDGFVAFRCTAKHSANKKSSQSRTELSTQVGTGVSWETRMKQIELKLELVLSWLKRNSFARNVML